VHITVLHSIRKQISQPPQHGIGYSVLRYLKSDAQSRARISEAALPEFNFNYLGQFDQELP
jgi:non-ribosomal peptide synthase protein (TIGR01720 family)